MLDLQSRSRLLDIQIKEAEAAGRFKVEPEEKAAAVECPFVPGMFDRLLDSIAQKSAAFEAEMDSAEQWKACQFHPDGPPALLNRDASMRTAEMVYTCHLCENQAREERFQKRIIAAGIPADVRHATLDNFDIRREGVKKGEGLVSPEKFWEKASKFAAGEIRNLILAGTPGIGKGHLAAALAILNIREGKGVLWTEAARLFSEVHRAYAKDRAEEITDRHARAHLLVLDEIALRDLPADGEEILFAIFDRRHKLGLRSILLSNKPAQAIRAWLGDRIRDRLRSGNVSFCYGEWDSMRGTQGDGAEEF